MLMPVRTIAPVAKLLTIQEVKAQCRIDGSDEDTLLLGLIDAATSYLDGYSGILGRALVNQTWQADFAGFGDEVRLPIGNLVSVTSVTYYDASNAILTLSSLIYAAFSDALGPYIALKPAQVWPSSYARPDAVRVTWVAGYGAAASDVPIAIRQAALLLVANWYDNRSAVSIGDTPTELPFAVSALLAPFRRVGV